MKKESTVLANARSWNYKTDFRHGSERPKRDPETLLRYKIPRKGEYFNYFLDMLNDQDYEVAKCGWKVISVLTVHPGTLEGVISLDILDKEDLKKEYLDTKNPFKLMYLLKIFHSLLKTDERACAKVHVIHDESEADKESIPLEVSGKSITKSTVPTPTPAKPNSISSRGKAENIVSAATQIKAPPIPSFPSGITEAMGPPPPPPSRNKTCEVQ